jgi:hypothetical protein
MSALSVEDRLDPTELLAWLCQAPRTEAGWRFTSRTVVADI